MPVFPVILGIHGVKGAGKNTTADFIADWAGEQSPVLSVCQRGFADKVKLAFARQFFPNISQADAIKWAEEFKNSDARILVPWSDSEVQSVKFRDTLAQFATEGARDIYGSNFWVDQLLPTPVIINNDIIRHPYVLENWQRNFAPETTNKAADLCLITDLRFENEIERINNLGGGCIKVKRQDAEDAVVAESKAAGREIHRSELGLDDEFFDIIIDNSDNDLDAAKKRTVAEMEQIINGR